MRTVWHPETTLKRWFVFNFVGLMGIVVQLAALLSLTSGFQLNYLIATALAVETAVLHNFFWHERWTWADRTKDHRRAVLSRLLSFHLTNGVISIAGNLILMKFLVGRADFPYVPANLLAIAVCAILNFLAGDRIVFRAAGRHSRGRNSMMNHDYKGIASLIFFAIASLLLRPPPSNAAELRPETLRAWDLYVEAVENRIGKELSSQKGFLAMDFQNPAESADERRAVLAGQITIRRMPVQSAGGETIRARDGMIHHWRGSIFIPGVPLDFVFSRVTNPTAEDTRQEDVLDSRVLESAPGQLRLYLKLQRSQIVTVVYNTEHLVRYGRRGSDQAVSSSIATKITEIEHPDNGAEHERPEGHDRGFLWRMNSYWRYQRTPGGVIVECESITLSRSIPSFLEYMVRPLINNVARESMQRTLQSMRMRMIDAYARHGHIRIDG